jgi:hypothetical protein
MISLQETTFKASLKASLSTTHPHDDFVTVATAMVVVPMKELN